MCSNFTTTRTAYSNNVFMAELRWALGQPGAAEAATTAENIVGRTMLTQAFFPQGIDNTCTFLAQHMPNSNVRLSSARNPKLM